MTNILALAVEIIKALAIYMRYRFDPEMIRRRDEIHQRLLGGKNRDEVNALLAGKDVLGVSCFLNEYLRLVRSQVPASAANSKPDLLDRILPKPRDEKDRDSDSSEGLSG